MARELARLLLVHLHPATLHGGEAPGSGQDRAPLLLGEEEGERQLGVSGFILGQMEEDAAGKARNTEGRRPPKKIKIFP